MRLRASLCVLWLCLCQCMMTAGPAICAEPPPLLSFQTRDGAGRPFDLRSLRGQAVALSFASRYTQDEAGRVFAALGQKARPGQVAAIGVIDFVGIPRLFHGFARRKVQQSEDPHKTRLLIDEGSALQKDLQTRPDQRVDILILDHHGALRGRYIGERHVAEALSLMDRLQREAAGALALAH